MSERAWHCHPRDSVRGAFCGSTTFRLSLHHDEGVNGNFWSRWFARQYAYNRKTITARPSTLSAITLVRGSLRKAFGDKLRPTLQYSSVTGRLRHCTIWLVLLLRKRIGTIGRCRRQVDRHIAGRGLSLALFHPRSLLSFSPWESSSPL